MKRTSKRAATTPFTPPLRRKSGRICCKKNGEEVNFVFRSVFAGNAEHMQNIRFYFNHDLTDNIILRGIPAATQRVLCGCKNKVKPYRFSF